MGPAGILVANAGTGPRAELEDVDVSAWDDAMAINLRASFLLAKAVIPGMRERGYGRIVFITSVAPGLIETDMTAGDPRLADPDQVNPAGRLGRAEEVAEAVAMVAGNPFITGQAISVDGGLYPR